MSKVWLIGDTHFGHQAIGDYRRHMGIASMKQNEEVICDNWNDLVKKKDLVFVMGDAAFTEEGIDLFGKLKGRKILIRGNHDMCKTISYLRVFADVYGTRGYKECWLSHIPIHPDDMRKKTFNIHAHKHCDNVIGDARYINVCLDHIYFKTGNFLITYTDAVKMGTIALDEQIKNMEKKSITNFK